jgi:ABC-type nitrate/sulfonate/bicarbonate transport system ATPase subunit
MSAFAVNILQKAYYSAEGKRLAIAGLSFEVREGELVCVLGPSGAGKTTMLNIIAGLDSSFEGKVSFLNAEPRRLSYVFQDPRLLPWRTLIENVALPLKGKADALDLAASWLDRVGLSGCHNLYPGQASIGMQRRAAIARAFAFGPTVLLMDEPFVSLDEKAAQELRSLFLALWQAERVTTLFVTHNVAEAAALATRVLVFSGCPARIDADIDIRKEEASRGDAESLLRSALDAAHAGSINT